MGKVLKAIAIIAVAAAVAYFAPQLLPALIGTGTVATAVTTAIVSAAIATAVSTGLSLLAGKPSTSGAAPSVFRQSISNSFIIYGKRRVGGLLIFFHPIGKDWRYFVIAVAGHRCKGVVRWWLNDEEVFVDGSGKVLTGKYANNAALVHARDRGSGRPSDVRRGDAGQVDSRPPRAEHRVDLRQVQDDRRRGPSGDAEHHGRGRGKDDILDPRTNTRGYTRNAALVFYDWLALPAGSGFGL